MKPFLVDMMNATSIAFDRDGQMYVSSRNDGAVYKVAPNGTMSTYAEGMESRPGLPSIAKKTCTSAIAAEQFSRSRATGRFLCFATLEPSVSAYHLAFGPR